MPYIKPSKLVYRSISFPVIKLAVVDAVVGCVPVAGTIFDIFIRPSRKALDVVHTHIREEYAIQSDMHVVHPYLHEKLEKKQQQSAFWRNPVVSWLWLQTRFIRGIGAYFDWFCNVVGNQFTLGTCPFSLIKKPPTGGFFIYCVMGSLTDVELQHAVRSKGEFGTMQPS